MNATAPFDTMALANGLRDEAGFEQKQGDELARKRDLRELEARLIDRMDSKIDVTAANLRAEIATAKAEMVKWLFIATIAAQTALLLAAMRLMH